MIKIWRRHVKMIATMATGNYCTPWIPMHALFRKQESVGGSPKSGYAAPPRNPIHFRFVGSAIKLVQSHTSG